MLCLVIVYRRFGRIYCSLLQSRMVSQARCKQTKPRAGNRFRCRRGKLDLPLDFRNYMFWKRILQNWYIYICWWHLSTTFVTTQHYEKSLADVSGCAVLLSGEWRKSRNRLIMKMMHCGRWATRGHRSITNRQLLVRVRVTYVASQRCRKTAKPLLSVVVIHADWIIPCSRILLETLIAAHFVKICPTFMEPEASLQCSQKPATIDIFVRTLIS